MRLGLSQGDCARALEVPLETLRTWDAGRRQTPESLLRRAQALAPIVRPGDRVPLNILATEFHVHVRTLRAAARDGRLAATFGPQAYFGRLTATATRKAAEQFMAMWYRRTYGRGTRRPVSVCRITVPTNCATTLVGLRLRLGLSQRQLAERVGAASKAVIYQWESGKRKPSAAFWLRVERLKRQQPTA